MDEGGMSTSTPSTALNTPLAVLKCFTMSLTCSVIHSRHVVMQGVALVMPQLSLPVRHDGDDAAAVHQLHR